MVSWQDHNNLNTEHPHELHDEIQCYLERDVCSKIDKLMFL